MIEKKIIEIEADKLIQIREIFFKYLDASIPKKTMELNMILVKIQHWMQKKHMSNFSNLIIKLEN